MTTPETLEQYLGDYLALRRSLGFKLVQHQQQLEGFARYCRACGAGHITVDLALAWATTPATAQPGWYRMRLGMVRSFAAYLHALDPLHQLIPISVLAMRGYDRPPPYLFTPAQIAALVEHAATAAGRNTSMTRHAFFGLVGVTGIRPGEAITLPDDHVDLEAGCLTVVGGKSGAERTLPLHPSTVAALAAYRQWRDQAVPSRRHHRFFTTGRGGPMWRTDLETVFRDLAAQLGHQARSPRCRPCLKSLRHSFAVNTLISWYHRDIDVSARLPVLSAWMGHIDPASTYWYLTASPELMTLAAARLAAARRPAPTRTETP